MPKRQPNNFFKLQTQAKKDDACEFEYKGKTYYRAKMSKKPYLVYYTADKKKCTPACK